MDLTKEQLSELICKAYGERKWIAGSSGDHVGESDGIGAPDTLFGTLPFRENIFQNIHTILVFKE